MYYGYLQLVYIETAYVVVVLYQPELSMYTLCHCHPYYTSWISVKYSIKLISFFASVEPAPRYGHVAASVEQKLYLVGRDEERLSRVLSPARVLSLAREASLAITTPNVQHMQLP